MNTRDHNAASVEMWNAGMPDVQRSQDRRELRIDRVGVKDLRYPLRWLLADGTEQTGVANFSLYVALAATEKGTHMSRFIELLEHVLAPGRPPLDVAGLPRLHADMLARLHADSGRIEIGFTLFLKKAAPVSRVESLLDYQVAVAIDGAANAAALALTVVVPVKSLCPCSKSIADYGAHNQRSHVTITVRSVEPIPAEQLIRIAESEASSEIYGLLKRADEKYITERAYDNPKFVEDLVRDVAARVKVDLRVLSFSVEAENFESIHNHSAYARIDG